MLVVYPNGEDSRIDAVSFFKNIDFSFRDKKEQNPDTQTEIHTDRQIDGAKI